MLQLLAALQHIMPVYYVCNVSSYVCWDPQLSQLLWTVQVVVPALSATIPKQTAEKVALDVLAHFFKEMQEKTRVTEELEEGEDLCDCEFSLAYGASCSMLCCPLPQAASVCSNLSCMWLSRLYTAVPVLMAV